MIDEEDPIVPQGPGLNPDPTTIDQEAYIAAWNFACHAHRGQKLPGCELPYVNHIGSVAMEVLVAIAGGGAARPDLAIQCALLHDVLEDTETGYAALEAAFGAAVAQGVLALSKDPGLPGRAAQMEDSLTRIRLQPREIWMVKLADRITNLQPPPSHWPAAKITAYLQEAVLIHRTLGDADRLLAERLAQKIAAYARYASE